MIFRIYIVCCIFQNIIAVIVKLNACSNRNESFTEATDCDNRKFVKDSNLFDFFDISINVFGFNRESCLSRLLTTLEYSCYPKNVKIPLTIWLDSGHTQSVSEVANEFHWSHGEKYIHPFRTHLGLRGVWGNFWKQPKQNEIRFVFEDDAELSSLYFYFFELVMNKYFIAPNTDSTKLTFHLLMEKIIQNPYSGSVVGIALSSMFYNEISCYRRFCPINMNSSISFSENELWHSLKQLKNEQFYNIDWSPSNFTSNSLFLHSVPGSWGAAYFGWHWYPFMKFFEVRSNPPFHFHEESHPELILPFIRTNNWPRSWKRFLIDYMYVNGLVMMYSNAPRSSTGLTFGYSANLMAVGEHRKRNVKYPYDSGLINWELHNTVINAMTSKSLSELTIFDMHSIPRPSIDDLKIIGDDFIIHCGILNSSSDPLHQTLKSLWKVQLTLNP